MRNAKVTALRYLILRNGEQYGPYSQAEVQRYLRTGDIYPGDLGRSEEMKEWLPVSQVLETGAPPPPLSAAHDDSHSSVGLPPHTVLRTPDPPGLHWGVLLVLAVLTCGLFGWIWSLVLAGWVRKIDPHNRATLLLVSCLALSIVAMATLYVAPDHLDSAAALAQLSAAALFLLAIFEMRRSIMAFYGEHEDVPLFFNSAMTLFFNVVYFQFKFNRMRLTKSTGQLMTLHHS